jgi:hypothetical protein
MHHGHTPAGLCLQAFALWQAEDPADGSLAYWTVDNDTSNGVEISARSSSRLANKWVTKLHSYEDFWRTEGRSPRENTRDLATLPAPERRLGQWGRYQRRFEENLCRYQEIRLDVSPAFRWDPHEEGWQARLDACLSHRNTTGRLPYLNSSDPIEFAHARWLGRQLRQLQRGTQSPTRAVRLTAFLTEKPTL